MDIDLLITLVVASIISAIIITLMGIVVLSLIKNKKIKKILRKIFKI
jgi:hypothetical protein